MRQYTKIFNDYQRPVDDQINDYLTEHPNYEIYSTSWIGEASDASDRVLVVFNIGEPPKRRKQSADGGCPPVSKCDNCALRYVCDEQTEFDCKQNNYSYWRD